MQHKSSHVIIKMALVVLVGGVLVGTFLTQTYPAEAPPYVKLSSKETPKSPPTLASTPTVNQYERARHTE